MRRHFGACATAPRRAGGAAASRAGPRFPPGATPGGAPTLAGLLLPRRGCLLLLLALGLPLAPIPAPGWNDDLLRAAALRLGPDGQRALPALQGLLQALQQADATPDPLSHRRGAGWRAPPPADVLPDGDAARLWLVNRFFNERVRFASDLDTWGREDHWTTPLELLARGQGDCEDYAIAKYAVLVATGMPSARLRLVYVRAQLPPARAGGAVRTEPHMVLAYQATLDAEPLILDNLRPDIVPAGQRSDLQPVFSFNSEGLWDAATAQPAGHPLQRISRWREVLARLRAEGLHP
jgi:predicted transglutaminase-like cysteine proteinase